MTDTEVPTRILITQHDPDPDEENAEPEYSFEQEELSLPPIGKKDDKPNLVWNHHGLIYVTGLFDETLGSMTADLYVTGIRLARFTGPLEKGITAKFSLMAAYGSVRFWQKASELWITVKSRALGRDYQGDYRIYPKAS